MVRVVVAHREDLREARVVRCHHLLLGRLLRLQDELLDVLHRSERLCPQLERTRCLELLEPRFNVHLQAVHVALPAVAHAVELVPQVLAQDVAQAAELLRPLVRQAEAERAHGDRCIEDLELGVDAQDIERRAIRVPQEAEPRCHQLAVRAVLALVGRYIAEHHVLGRRILLQILDVDCHCRDLRLRRLCLFAGLLQEILDNLLKRRDVDGLTHVPVIRQRFLGIVALLGLHSEVNVLEHDLLINR
mmetsp:Transcript_43312/g.129890  ORF Transcript_43312/g.129890 Transcript_43312/m.129890 type:complete len:246 (-) Transcript_43312:166-903(-)